MHSTTFRRKSSQAGRFPLLDCECCLWLRPKQAGHWLLFPRWPLHCLHLRDVTRQPITGLFVRVSEICPELSRQKPVVVPAGRDALVKKFCASDPTARWSGFPPAASGRGCGGPHHRVADAVVMVFIEMLHVRPPVFDFLESS